ncbi:MAG: glycosyltransferase [Fluviibacter sp.]
MSDNPLVIHVISSMSNGGAQEVLKTITDINSGQYDQAIFYMRGVNAYESDQNKSVAHAISLNINSISDFLHAIKTIRSIVQDSKNSVCLQGWMYQGNFLALIIKFLFPSLPVIFSIHNGSDDYTCTSLSGYVTSRFCAFFSSFAELTIFVSQKSLQEHVTYQKSVVIPNPLKPFKIGNVPSFNNYAMTDCPITLACVARFDRIKNIDFLLDVIKSLKNMGGCPILLMAGDGMSNNNDCLMQMLRVRNLESSVELLGIVDDISLVYERSDFTILTSKCESFSNVLLESIACGTPFISSEVGVARDLLSPNSLVVQGYKVSEWTACLQAQSRKKKTPEVSLEVKKFYDQIKFTYQPERIARLYAACWAKAVGQ